MIEKLFTDLTEAEKKRTIENLLALPFDSDIMFEVLTDEKINVFEAENYFCIALADLQKFIDTCIGKMFKKAIG